MKEKSIFLINEEDKSELEIKLEKFEKNNIEIEPNGKIMHEKDWIVYLIKDKAKNYKGYLSMGDKQYFVNDGIVYNKQGTAVVPEGYIRRKD